jgi:hypothetical protein
MLTLLTAIWSQGMLADPTNAVILEALTNIAQRIAPCL